MADQLCVDYRIDVHYLCNDISLLCLCGFSLSFLYIHIIILFLYIVFLLYYQKVGLFAGGTV